MADRSKSRDRLLKELAVVRRRVAKLEGDAARWQVAEDLTRRQPIDVVISDLGMPAMNGWEVGKRIKEWCSVNGRPKPLFVLFTGCGGQLDEAERRIDSGVDAIPEKPVDIDRLVKTVLNLYGKRHAY